LLGRAARHVPGHRERLLRLRSHGLPAEPGTGAPAGGPVIMIVVHGTLAASTILLVVLAAAGAS